MVIYMITFYHIVVIFHIQVICLSHIKNTKTQIRMVNIVATNHQVIRRQLNNQRQYSMFKHHLDITKQHILIQISVWLHKNVTSTVHQSMKKHQVKTSIAH